MNARIDLVWLGTETGRFDWPLGDCFSVAPDVLHLSAFLQEQVPRSQAAGWLFWDPGLGKPEPEKILRAFELPGDLWHAGLRLASNAPAGLLASVAFGSMFARDPDPEIEATSWRISFQACLVRSRVLHQLGGVHDGFLTLEGAAWELGYRCLKMGALPRHIPWLVGHAAQAKREALPFEDELRFVRQVFGASWAAWALLRAVMRRAISPARALAAGWNVFRDPRPSPLTPYQHEAPPSAGADTSALRFPLSALPPQPRVSVLIPTVDRYPYLRTLLDQLRHQTVRPLEIIVVDQTQQDWRDAGLADQFKDLPLRLIDQDEAGQCSSRNAGLQIARGDYILFLDDDDEIKPDLIEAHLRILARFRADASSGVAEEADSGPLPSAFTYLRGSNVFPTNNTMVRREVLGRSGLFDLAYNRGSRADGDLGMRVYLSGALMLLDPSISVFHHHAPSGGLRMHKARVVTLASSRRQLTHLHLPSVTEIYLAYRYFGPNHVREMLWVRVLKTLVMPGGLGRRLLRLAYALVCLPYSIGKTRQQRRRAEQMLTGYPQIPQLV